MIFAVTGGFLDDYPVEDAKRFEKELLEFVDPAIPKSPRRSRKAVRSATNRRTSSVRPSRSSAPASAPPKERLAKEAAAEPLSEEELERLKKFRRPTEEEFQKRAGPAGEGGGTAGVPG